jgi:hypothetical protein
VTVLKAKFPVLQVPVGRQGIGQLSEQTQEYSQTFLTLQMAKLNGCLNASLKHQKCHTKIAK